MARQEEFQTTIGLVNEFKLPIKYVTKTKAQLSAIILDAKQPTVARDDEMAISFPDTLKIFKYGDVKTFYENTRDYEQTYIKKYIFAWGTSWCQRKLLC